MILQKKKKIKRNLASSRQIMIGPEKTGHGGAEPNSNYFRGRKLEIGFLFNGGTIMVISFEIALNFLFIKIAIRISKKI